MTSRTRRKPRGLNGSAEAGFSDGFSQGEEAIEAIEPLCYNRANVGFGCTVTRFGGRT